MNFFFSSSVITKNLLALSDVCGAGSVAFEHSGHGGGTHEHKKKARSEAKKKKSKALEREVLIYGTTRNQVFAVIHLTSRAWFRKLIWILWRLISLHAYLRRTQKQTSERASERASCFQTRLLIRAKSVEWKATEQRDMFHGNYDGFCGVLQRKKLLSRFAISSPTQSCWNKTRREEMMNRRARRQPAATGCWSGNLSACVKKGNFIIKSRSGWVEREGRSQKGWSEAEKATLKLFIPLTASPWETQFSHLNSSSSPCESWASRGNKCAEPVGDLREKRVRYELDDPQLNKSFRGENNRWQGVGAARQ